MTLYRRMVEDYLPEDTYIPPADARPKLGARISTIYTVGRIKKYVEGFDRLIVHWEKKKLPTRIEGFYAGHRWLPFGLLQEEGLAKIEQHGGCNVALISYHERKKLMYVPWSAVDIMV